MNDWYNLCCENFGRGTLIYNLEDQKQAGLFNRALYTKDTNNYKIIGVLCYDNYSLYKELMLPFYFDYWDWIT